MECRRKKSNKILLMITYVTISKFLLKTQNQTNEKKN